MLAPLCCSNPLTINKLALRTFSDSRNVPSCIISVHVTRCKISGDPGAGTVLKPTAPTAPVAGILISWRLPTGPAPRLILWVGILFALGIIAWRFVHWRRSSSSISSAPSTPSLTKAGPISSKGKSGIANREEVELEPIAMTTVSSCGDVEQGVLRLASVRDAIRCARICDVELSFYDDYIVFDFIGLLYPVKRDLASPCPETLLAMLDDTVKLRLGHVFLAYHYPASHPSDWCNCQDAASRCEDCDLFMVGK